MEKDIREQTIKINDANSVLEVYLEYIHNNLKDGIAIEKIGYLPFDKRFKLYMICNKDFRFVVCGTYVRPLLDKRFKNIYNVFKKATFFSYPKDENLQIFDKKNYKEIINKICDENEYKEEFNWSNIPQDILNYLKSDQ